MAGGNGGGFASAAAAAGSGEIIQLNVGGTRFSTSRQTLMWIPDSFFSSLLSGRISTLRDETGALFVTYEIDEHATHAFVQVICKKVQKQQPSPDRHFGVLFWSTAS